MRLNRQRQNKGFLELTAATVFGLVMLAASAVGVLIGTVAVQQKTGPIGVRAYYDWSFANVNITPNAASKLFTITGRLNRNGCAPGGNEDIYIYIYKADGGDYIANMIPSVFTVNLPSPNYSACGPIDFNFTVTMTDAWATAGYPCTSVRLKNYTWPGGEGPEKIVTLMAGASCPTPTATPAPTNTPTPTVTVPPVECETGNDCPDNKICCRNKCVDHQTDPDNCGSCAKKCGAGQQCVQGKCVTPTATGTPVPTATPTPDCARLNDITTCSACISCQATDPDIVWCENYGDDENPRSGCFFDSDICWANNGTPKTSCGPVPTPTPTAKAPVLSVSPATLTFTATEGGSNPPDQNLTITNTGGGTLNWEATTNAVWLRVNPASGSTTTSSVIKVGVNTAGVPQGPMNGQISITHTAPGGLSKTINVTLTVSPAGVTATPTPTKPDLTVTNIVIPSNIVAGQRVTFQVIFKNIGSQLRINTEYRVKLAPQQTGANNIVLSEASLGWFEAGQEKIITVPLVPAGQTGGWEAIAGTYKVVAEANYLRDAEEVTYDNNTKTSENFTVASAPTPMPTPTVTPTPTSIPTPTITPAAGGCNCPAVPGPGGTTWACRWSTECDPQNTGGNCNANCGTSTSKKCCLPDPCNNGCHPAVAPTVCLSDKTRTCKKNAVGGQDDGSIYRCNGTTHQWEYEGTDPVCVPCDWCTNEGQCRASGCAWGGINTSRCSQPNPSAPTDGCCNCTGGTGAGGEVSFNTDLNKDGVTNTLDWSLLVFGWTDGKYSALDASNFLSVWAAQRPQ